MGARGGDASCAGVGLAGKGRGVDAAGGPRILLVRGQMAKAVRRKPSRSKRDSGAPSPELIRDLVTANHILFQQGVVDGFGHVSVRHDKDPTKFLLARNMAPAL